MQSRQRYVSPELTHFVGSGREPEAQYELLKRIINSGWLTHPPHNPNISGNLSVDSSRSICENEMYAPEIVCFCDIPVADLEIHMGKYSHFGIAFLKTFLIEQGANPVFYIAKNSKVRKLKSGDALQDAIKAKSEGNTLSDLNNLFDSVTRCEHYDASIREYHKIMRIAEALVMQAKETPGVPPDFTRLNAHQRFLSFNVFSFMKFFDDAHADDDPRNFYMEREWRVVGNVAFELGNIERVIVPRAYATRFRQEVPEYVGQLSFVD